MCFPSHSSLTSGLIFLAKTRSKLQTGSCLMLRNLIGTVHFGKAKKRPCLDILCVQGHTYPFRSRHKHVGTLRALSNQNKYCSNVYRKHTTKNICVCVKLTGPSGLSSTPSTASCACKPPHINSNDQQTEASYAQLIQNFKKQFVFVFFSV